MKRSLARQIVPEAVVHTLRATLPDSQHKHLNKYLWVVHKVLEQQAFKRKQIAHKYNGYVPLHSQLIASAVTPPFYKEVMNTLKNTTGILLCDEHYVTAKDDPINAQSKGYKIAPAFLNSPLISLEADKGITTRINKSKYNDAYIPTSSIEKHLKKQLQSFYIDDAVYDFLQSRYNVAYKEIKKSGTGEQLHQTSNIFLPTHIPYVLSFPHNSHDTQEFTEVPPLEDYITDMRLISAINNGEEMFLRDVQCRRVFTEYNLMRKIYRPYWRHVSGERLVELDISNSQPLILCTLFGEYFKGQWPGDAIIYKQRNEIGMFYNHLMDLVDLSQEERATFKIDMFAEVFYCPDPNKCSRAETKAKYYTERTKLFEKHYPEVYKLICAYKPKNDYARLAITMMQRESNLMIDGACGKLLKDFGGSVPLNPIHDSIVTTESHAKAVGKAILDAFADKYNIYPTLKSKYLDTGEIFVL